MKKRGQSKEAWMSRWRDGACPVHGGGFIEDAPVTLPAAGALEGIEAGAEMGAPVAVKCSVEECTVRALRFAAGDAHHASFGWRAGPDEIRALLAKAGDLAPEGDQPGPRARRVRTSYALEE